MSRGRPEAAGAIGAMPVADLGESTGPEHMVRHPRATGGLLLVVGAVAVLVARALLAPDLPGVAAPAPWPLPPAVGSCVLVDVESVEQVPCDQPHSGEVVATWPAGERPRSMLEGDAARPITVSVTRTLPVAPQDQLCQGWVEQYIGWTTFTLSHRGAGRWIAPQPVVAGRLVSAPPGEGTADLHWTACVTQTQQPLYTGTVKAAAVRSAGLPEQISICISPAVTAVDFVSCDQPHTTELIAVMALSVAMMTRDTLAVDHTPDEIRQLCVGMAASRAGTADPTYAGQLEVVTESAWAQRKEPVEISEPFWLIPDCLVRVTGGGQLIGSIVGHGAGPLPWLN